MAKIPCTGCGECCRTEPCFYTFIVYNGQWPCPGLYYSELDKKWRCEAVDENYDDIVDGLQVGGGCAYHTGRLSIVPNKDEAKWCEPNMRICRYRLGIIDTHLEGDTP